MRNLGKLTRINLKLSVKHVAKTSPKPNKCDLSVWDALAWEGLEKHLHDIPTHPCVSRMWRALFSRETKTPLQKCMVAVNSRSTLESMPETLSIFFLIESLDNNILHIENVRARIDRLEETYKDIVDDTCHANREKKINIPESYVTRLDQMEKELTGLDTSICSGISDLQNLRFGFVPREAPKNSSTSGKRATGNREMEERINEIAEQIIRGGGGIKRKD
jgi:hypothetical protein